MSGLEVLEKIKNISPNVVIVMVTAFRDIKMVVEATKLGAYDYLVKPIDSHELRLTVKNSLENRVLKNHLQLFQQEENKRNNPMLTGKSKVMQDISILVDKIAPSIDTPVLITGETGSGKGVLAKKIHLHSPNHLGPFITVNCGALAGELVESELFGYAKGAFTGARAGGRKGRFEEAAGGTLFLDEIGVMSPAAQTKLLSILEDRTFYKVGGNREIKVTARIIAATNLDLEKAVTDGTFRQDLFFRLNIITISIPPLRKRPEDILPLFEHFMQFFNQKTGKHFTSISQEAADILLRYSWPGNIRELRNIMERLSLLEDEDTILPEHLPCAAVPGSTAADKTADQSVTDFDYDKSKQRLIEQALRHSKGNITKTAQLLNMAPHKLRYRMKKMNWGMHITPAHTTYCGHSLSNGSRFAVSSRKGKAGPFKDDAGAGSTNTACCMSL